MNIKAWWRDCRSRRAARREARSIRKSYFDGQEPASNREIRMSILDEEQIRTLKANINVLYNNGQRPYLGVALKLRREQLDQLVIDLDEVHTIDHLIREEHRIRGSAMV